MRLSLKILLVALVSVASLGWMWHDSVARNNRLGKRLYDEGKIDEALKKWRDAQVEDPDREELNYNIGNALYRKQQHEDAYREYERALDSKDTEFQSRTYYNMGNANYRMGKLSEAIEDYKKALDKDPADEDAKFNIEFVRKKMKEEKKKEDKKGSSQETGAKKDQASKKEKKEGGEKTGEKKEKMPDKREGARRIDGEKNGKKNREMSKEDALRLLDALRDDEKDLQKRLKRNIIEPRYRVDKDW